MDNRPIGIFDTGLGGLTAAKQMMKMAPNENIVYLGDTGRAPYGMRAPETIVKFSGEITDYLMDLDVKMLVVACGTISCHYHKVDTKGIPYSDILTPTSKDAVRASKNKRIGVISTAATAKSGAFAKKMKEIDSSVEVFNIACPLFVPLVEYGFVEKNDPITTLTVERYLRYFKDKDIDTLILGCTHFPLLADFIADYMGEGVTLIDPGVSTTKDTLTYLKEHDMLNSSSDEGTRQFFCTDSPDNFKNVAKIFLGQDISDYTTQITLGENNE